MSWGQSFEAPVVRGMPYATVIYTGMTPVMKFGHAILSFDGSGTRYEVTLNNEQKWIIYASSEIRYRSHRNQMKISIKIISSFTKSGDDLVASGPFTGSIRAAGVWDGVEGDVSVLDAHASAVPTGGTV